MRIEQIRRLHGAEIIDYQSLVTYLRDYARPREKITAWLESKALIRLKKGLYVFGKEIALTDYPIETLANLMYGPSALSCAYALAFYGLIPEKVSLITSITSHRNKFYKTPLANFRYYYLNPKKYAVSIQLDQNSRESSFLIASKEKALSDQLCIVDKKVKLLTFNDIKHYLFSDLRIDPDALSSLDLIVFEEIVKSYRNSNLTFLYQFLKEMRHASSR